MAPTVAVHNVLLATCNCALQIRCYTGADPGIFDRGVPWFPENVKYNFWNYKIPSYYLKA